jgi:hypothetical protein
MANGIDEAAFRNLANVLNMTSRELTRFADKLKDGTADLGAMEQRVDSAAKKFNSFETAAQGATGEVRGFRNEMDLTRDTLSTFRGLVGGLVGGVGKTFMGAIVGMAGATIKSSFEMAKLGYDLEKAGLGPTLRRYGGDTREALRGLEHGAGLAGINLSAFAKIVTEHSQGIGAAGIDDFGRSVQSVRDTFTQLRKDGKEYGYTQEAITEYMGLYEGVILSQARTLGMTGERRSRENERFLLETAELASTFKKSREQIAKESAEMLQEPNSAFLAMQLSFEAEGTAAAANLNDNLALLKQALDPQTFNTALEALSTSLSVGTEFASKDLRELYGMAPDMADAVVEIVNSMKSGQKLDKNFLSDVLGNAFNTEGFSLAASIAGATGGFNAATQAMAETLKRLELMNTNFTDEDAINIADAGNSVLKMVTTAIDQITDSIMDTEKAALDIVSEPAIQSAVDLILESYKMFNKEIADLTSGILTNGIAQIVEGIAFVLNNLVYWLTYATDFLANLFYGITNQQDKVSNTSAIYSVLRDEIEDPAERGQVMADMMRETPEEREASKYKEYWGKIEKKSLGDTWGGKIGNRIGEMLDINREHVENETFSFISSMLDPTKAAIFIGDKYIQYKTSQQIPPGGGGGGWGDDSNRGGPSGGGGGGWGDDSNRGGPSGGGETTMDALLREQLELNKHMCTKTDAIAADMHILTKLARDSQ